MATVEEKIIKIKEYLDYISFKHKHPEYANDLYKLLDDIQNEYNKMQEINIPKKVITEDWESSVCPNCKENFSEYEECDDGYYQRAYSLERCPYCGQKLKWE